MLYVFSVWFAVILPNGLPKSLQSLWNQILRYSESNDKVESAMLLYLKHWFNCLKSFALLSWNLFLLDLFTVIPYGLSLNSSFQKQMFVSLISEDYWNQVHKIVMQFLSLCITVALLCQSGTIIDYDHCSMIKCNVHGNLL